MVDARRELGTISGISSQSLLRAQFSPVPFCTGEQCHLNSSSLLCLVLRYGVCFTLLILFLLAWPASSGIEQVLEGWWNWSASGGRESSSF